MSVPSGCTRTTVSSICPPSLELADSATPRPDPEGVGGWPGRSAPGVGAGGGPAGGVLRPFPGVVGAPQFRHQSDGGGPRAVLVLTTNACDLRPHHTGLGPAYPCP